LALAAAVRQAQAQASYGARPIPASVYQQLQGYLLPTFCRAYNTFDNARISLDNAVMLLNHDVVAITLNDIIVFRNENEPENAYTWAHQLTHALQYRNMGIDAFANTYTTNAWVLENQAKDNAARFAQTLAAGQGQQVQQQFAYFNVTGQFLYGDAYGNLYPANPNTGQVVGSANGRVFFQNGQYFPSIQILTTDC
jgi:Zn-dependent peptidase ImmA (M78 family)